MTELLMGASILLSVIAAICSVFAVVEARARPGPPRSCDSHGHRFEGRYHTTNEPTLKSVDRASVSAMVRLANATRRKASTYVHDICVYCGEKR